MTQADGRQPATLIDREDEGEDVSLPVVLKTLAIDGTTAPSTPATSFLRIGGALGKQRRGLSLVSRRSRGLKKRARVHGAGSAAGQEGRELHVLLATNRVMVSALLALNGKQTQPRLVFSTISLDLVALADGIAAGVTADVAVIDIGTDRRVAHAGPGELRQRKLEVPAGCPWGQQWLSGDRLQRLGLAHGHRWLRRDAGRLSDQSVRKCPHGLGTRDGHVAAPLRDRSVRRLLQAGGQRGHRQ